MPPEYNPDWADQIPGTINSSHLLRQPSNRNTLGDQEDSIRRSVTLGAAANGNMPGQSGYSDTLLSPVELDVKGWRG
jgi:hypothetical protein